MVALGAVHMPLPSQVDGGVATLPAQAPAAHTVPAGYLRQAPLPSHLPSVLQVVAAATAHIMRGSALPAGIAVQVPGEAATLHARHDPQALAAQQTPSTQLPLAHCPPDVHGRPSPRKLPQVPPLHRLGGAQSALLVQVVRHAFLVASQA